jgi:hypothetical protein
VRQGREGGEGESEVRAVAGGVIRERDRESRRGVKNGRTHILEVEMEGLQEWRVGGGIWRGMQNGDLFRGSARVGFLHKTSIFWSRGPYWSCSNIVIHSYILEEFLTIHLDS